MVFVTITADIPNIRKSVVSKRDRDVLFNFFAYKRAKQNDEHCHI